MQNKRLCEKARGSEFRLVKKITSAAKAGSRVFSACKTEAFYLNIKTIYLGWKRLYADNVICSNCSFLFFVCQRTLFVIGQ